MDKISRLESLTFEALNVRLVAARQCLADDKPMLLPKRDAAVLGNIFGSDLVATRGRAGTVVTLAVEG